MGSKETTVDDQAASFSWWWDSRNRPHQSQWLQAHLLDLNEKTKLMLSILEEDGDSFVKRAEMFYKRKPKLINLLEDLYKSFRSLAEKYDQLRSELIQASQLRSFSSLHSLKLQTIQKCEKDVKALKKPVEADDQESYEESIVKEIDDDGVGSGGDCNGEKEKMWDEKMSKLVEDNMQQQAELIRRNKEKSEIIERLVSQVQRLMDENRTLKSHLAGRYGEHLTQNQSEFSRHLVSRYDEHLTQNHSQFSNHFISGYGEDSTQNQSKISTQNQSKISRSKSKGPSFIGRLTGCTGT